MHEFSASDSSALFFCKRDRNGSAQNLHSRITVLVTRIFLHPKPIELRSFSMALRLNIRETLRPHVKKVKSQIMGVCSAIIKVELT